MLLSELEIEADCFDPTLYSANVTVRLTWTRSGSLHRRPVRLLCSANPALVGCNLFSEIRSNYLLGCYDC